MDSKSILKQNRSRRSRHIFFRPERALDNETRVRYLKEKVVEDIRSCGDSDAGSLIQLIGKWLREDENMCGDVTKNILEFLKSIGNDERCLSLVRKDVGLVESLALLLEKFQMDPSKSCTADWMDVDNLIQLLSYVIDNECKERWPTDKIWNVAEIVSLTCLDILQNFPVDSPRFLKSARLIVKCEELTSFQLEILLRTEIHQQLFTKLAALVNTEEITIVNLVIIQVLLGVDYFKGSDVVSILQHLENATTAYFHFESLSQEVEMDVDYLNEFHNILRMLGCCVRLGDSADVLSICDKSNSLTNSILNSILSNVGFIPNAVIGNLCIKICDAVLKIRDVFENTRTAEFCKGIVTIIKALSHQFRINEDISLSLLFEVLKTLCMPTNQNSVGKEDLEWILNILKFPSGTSREILQKKILIVKLYGILVSFPETQTAVKHIITTTFIKNETDWEQQFMLLGEKDLDENQILFSELSVLIFEILSKISGSSDALKLETLLNSPAAIPIIHKALVSSNAPEVAAAFSVLGSGLLRQGEMKSEVVRVGVNSNRSLNSIVDEFFSNMELCSRLINCIENLHGDYLQTAIQPSSRYYEMLEMMKEQSNLSHLEVASLRGCLDDLQKINLRRDKLFEKQNEVFFKMATSRSDSLSKVYDLSEKRNLLQKKIEVYRSLRKTQDTDIMAGISRRDENLKKYAKRLNDAKQNIEKLQLQFSGIKQDLVTYESKAEAMKSGCETFRQKVLELTQKISCLEKEKRKLEEEKLASEEVYNKCKKKLDGISSVLID